MKDFTDTKCGQWVITSFHHKTRKNTFWLARCKCGKESILRDDVIKQQRSNSCRSCANILRKVRGYTIWNKIENRSQVLVNTEYSTYKSQAKFGGKDFTLSKNEFTKLVTSNCHYCLDSPSRLIKDSFSSTTMFMHGIDRTDSSVGYITSNCVTCCAICNVMKNVLSTHEFKHHIAKIHANSSNF